MNGRQVPVRYDLAVIGAGSAGLSAARFARRLGLSVAIIEAARPGGDCTWTGCVPSKALLRVASLANGMRHAGRLGLAPASGDVDLPRIVERIRGVQAEIYRQESPDVLGSEGIAVIPGQASFESPHQLVAGDTTVTARRFLIATGAGPAVPPIPGLDCVPHYTYETIWDLPTLPRRLLVLGAGPIGCELAQAFRRLGSRVALVDIAGRPLPLEEPEASEVLRAQLEGEGVELHLNAGVERVERVADEVVVMAGGSQIRGDVLLVALGRRPRVDGLGLHDAGVAFSAAGVRVDRTLKTTARHIYAAGDCTGGYQFTHYAAWQGVIAVRNAFLPGKSSGVRDTVPGVTFTDPEVAHAGMTEAAARDRLGPRVSVVSWPNSEVDRALTDGAAAGFVRVVLAPDGRIVGATAVGPHAGETIHEWALAIDRKLRLADVASSIHVYPTYAFGHWQLAGEAHLTSVTRGLKGRFLRWLAAWGR